MATNSSHASPKDFFMHLLAIVTLYLTAFAFGTLAFQIINFNFPDELYYFSAQSFIDAIRFSVASLIITLPTFIVTSRMLTKEYTAHKEKKDLRIRMWLMYFTLFATAIAILSSLTSIVYQFLGGELTIRFGLKVLTVLFIAGMIFGYYLYKIKVEKEKQEVLYIFLGVTVVTALALIILAFTYTGSPSTQRMREFDEQRINQLGMISNEIQYHFDQKKSLPENLDVLQTTYMIIPTDPQTQEPYEYAIITPTVYELCATFNLDRFEPKGLTRQRSTYLSEQHFTAGRNCFTQTVRLSTDDQGKEIPPLPRQ